MSVISTPAIKTDINTNIFQNSSQLITGAILNSVLINIADSYLNRVTGGLLMQVETGYSTLVTITDEKAFTHKSYVDTAVAGLLPSGGTSAQYFAGDKTLVDFGTSVRATLLTGLPVFTNTVISATDSVLGAFSKLQGQISAIDTSVFVTYTGATTNVDLNNKTLLNVQAIGKFASGSGYYADSSGFVVASGAGNTASGLGIVGLTCWDLGIGGNQQTVYGYQGVTYTNTSTPGNNATFNLPLGTKTGSQTFAMLSDISGGGGITALTGDVTASGTGSVFATLATVNSNIGTFNNVTVNAKGLVTGASNVAYLTSLTGAYLVGGQTLVANDKLGSTNNVAWDLVAFNIPVLKINPVASADNYLQVSPSTTSATTGADLLVEAKASGAALTASINIKPLGATSELKIQPQGGNRTMRIGGDTIFSTDGSTNQVITSVSPWIFSGASTTSAVSNVQISGTVATSGANSRPFVRVNPTVNNTSASSDYRGVLVDPTFGSANPAFASFETNIADASNRFALRFTGTGRSSFGGNINLTGSAKITTYAGIATVSMGVAPIINDFSVTARTTAYTTQSLFTASATGLYELVITVEYASGSSLWVTGFQINYTNAGVASTHVIEPNYFTTQYSKTYVASIRCDSGTSVTFSTTLAGATTHNIDILTKRLR